MVEVRRGILWVTAAFGFTVVQLAAMLSGLRIDWSRSAMPMLMTGYAFGASMWRHRARAAWVVKLIDMVEGLSLFGLVAMIAAIASYVAASLSSGYVDDRLAAADRALGFDWLWLYHRVEPWATFHLASRVAYSSIFTTPTFILIGCAWLGLASRMRAFIAATGITLALTVAIFAWMPALSAVPYFMGMHPAYVPASDITHVAITMGLRHGTLTTLNPAAMGGLITFPSFHAAAAILYIWAAWPMRALRWPVLALNLMMLAATPLEGSHYFVDVLGGATVAAIGIATVNWPSLVAAAKAVVRLPVAPDLSTPGLRAQPTALPR